MVIAKSETFIGNTAVIERVGGRIIKHVEKCLEFGVFEREMEFLATLRISGFVPTVRHIDFASKTIEMDYCGEDLGRAKPPADAETQARYILGALQSLGIRHNDIRPENVCVKDGRLYLIDWQWATKEVLPPKEWPRGLGGKFRAGWPQWIFDDVQSLERVLSR